MLFVEGEVPPSHLLRLAREGTVGPDLPLRRLYWYCGRQLIQVCLEECQAPDAVIDAEAGAPYLLELPEDEREVFPIA